MDTGNIMENQLQDQFDAQEHFEKARQELLDNCEIKGVSDTSRGGQHVGIIRPLISIKSKDLDIEIICGYHKSRIKNTETARLMMKRVIETIIE